MEKIKRTLGFIFNPPLSKKHPYKSVLRLLFWQLQSSVRPNRLIIKNFIPGVKFYARKGLTGITGNIYSGLHEFNDMAFLLHLLRKDDAFFDIGANVGSYSLLASGFSKAKSFTLEPVMLTFEILTKNVSLNGLQNRITLINAGASAEKGHLVFSSGEDTTNHVIASDEIIQRDTIKVPVITVDSLLSDAQPTLIKIDVEGFETEVLKGMVKTLRSPFLKAIIIELNGSGSRYGFDENNIHSLLLDSGFKTYNYDPFIRKLIASEKFGAFNTIYCRDLDFINDRIKNAGGVKIMGEII